MTFLYQTSHIRNIEAQYPDANLMEKAGLATATLVQEMISTCGDRVLVIAGPGNNGGDAFVAARYLKAAWLKVRLVFVGEIEKLPADARSAYEAWIAVGGKCDARIPHDEDWDIVIDGLFGIGVVRDIQEPYAGLIRQINSLGLPVISLDVPSGLCADTGRIWGEAVKADHTLTFLGLKPGLFTLDGPDHTGLIHVSDLGIEAGDSPLRLIDEVPILLAPRNKNAHKGSYGSVGVIGGAEGMVGAALLSARAASLIGAGRVYCGMLAENAPALDVAHPELMIRPADLLDSLAHISVLVIGPGMGRSEAALSILHANMAFAGALVLDADALNLIAQHVSLQALLNKRPLGSTVITPHPGEAATLLGCTTAEVQIDRIAATRKLSADFNAITLLKGCGTVIAMPDGNVAINSTGNSGLSSAGMGDTLAGMIAALIAQGMANEDAVMLGVYLHGAAADELVEKGIGPVGLTASEVALEARVLLNEWIYSTSI